MMATDNPLDHLHQAISAALHRRNGLPPESAVRETARLSAFLNECCQRLGYPRATFITLLAARLDSEETFAAALLNGEVPAALLDNELLTDIAWALDCEPAILQAALDRTCQQFPPPATPHPADAVGRMVGQRYHLLEWLGAGSMGSVYRAHDKLHNQMVALKRLSTPVAEIEFATVTPTSNLAVALAQEFRLLASLHHPNIIQVLDYGFEVGEQPYFTMELLENAQTILATGTSLPIAGRLDLLVQLFEALAYLHRYGIVHRDLKPGNVLVVGQRVKVLDFGLSMRRDQHSGVAGTPKYMAPEVLRGAAATERADLYAAGLIAYQLLVGQYPYAADNAHQLLEAILHKSVDFAGLQSVLAAFKNAPSVPDINGD